MEFTLLIIFQMSGLFWSILFRVAREVSFLFASFFVVQPFKFCGNMQITCKKAILTSVWSTQTLVKTVTFLLSERFDKENPSFNATPVPWVLLWTIFGICIFVCFTYLSVHLWSWPRAERALSWKDLEQVHPKLQIFQARLEPDQECSLQEISRGSWTNLQKINCWILHSVSI